MRVMRCSRFPGRKEQEEKMIYKSPAISAAGSEEQGRVSHAATLLAPMALPNPVPPLAAQAAPAWQQLLLKKRIVC